MNKPAFLLLLSALATLLFATPSMAIEQGEINGLRYISGGIGGSERSKLQATAGGRYSLKITIFGNRSRAYRTQVPVWISTWQGETVFRAITAGPIIYIDLPPGRYRLRVDDPASGYEQIFGVGPSGTRKLRVLADPP